MRILFLPIALAVLGTRATAQEEKASPYYVQWGLGGVFSESLDAVSVSFDPGFTTDVAIGRRFILSSRGEFDLEIEGYYQYFRADKGDLRDLGIPSNADNGAKALAFMVNGIFDWQCSQQYSMYGGAGVGYAKNIDYEPFALEDSEAAAFQVKAGVDYNLGGNYDVLLGYRYFRTDTIDFALVGGGTDEVDLAQHVIEATFRWSL